MAFAGCATGPAQTSGTAPFDPAPFDPASVLSGLDTPESASAEQSRQTLKAVRDTRARHAIDLVHERIDCHKTFLVARCLERVGARERLLDDRLDAIEVRAQQRLRDLAAVERSQRDAQATMQWQADAQTRAQAEARNRERHEARLQQASEAEAERKAQAPELQRREQAQRDRQLERERAFEQRQSIPRTKAP